MQRTTQRRSVETWRELVARAFCSPAQCVDLLRLAVAAAQARSDGRGSIMVTEQSREPAGFIDLGVLNAVSSRCEIRLDLGGGVVLQVVRG